MSILAMLMIVVPALWGSGVLLVAGVRLEKLTLLLIGSVLGWTVAATTMYGLTAIFKLTVRLEWGLGLSGMLMAIWCWEKGWSHWRRLNFNKTTLIVVVALLVLSSMVAPKLIIEVEGELFTKVSNAWGDLGWHVANITMFAQGQSLPPENPIKAGTELVYPFLINFISGALVVAGATLVESVVVPAFVLITVFFALFYLVAVALSKSRGAGLIALLMLIGSGSTLGWTGLWSDLQTTDSWLGLLMNLPRDYSGFSSQPQGYHFINIITSLLLPQRSFLLGMPLAMSIVLLVLSAPKKATVNFVLAGILLGLLPLAHAHTALALLPVLGLLLLYEWRREKKIAAQWWWLVLAAVSVGLPEVWYYWRHSFIEGSFWRWQPGWTVGDHKWWLFWLKNTGLLLVATAAGILLKVPQRLKLLAGAGLVLWLAANLFAFAPWIWDNYKILIYWSIFSLPVIGWLLMKGLNNQDWRWRSAAVVFIVVHSLSGWLGVWSIVMPAATAWSLWDKNAVAAAEMIGQETGSGTPILTAPYHNNPAALAGRPVYLGRTAHVWSHGGQYYAREKAIAEFYKGKIETLPEIDVKHVVVGPVELGKYPVLIIREDWELIGSAGGYDLYSIAP